MIEFVPNEESVLFAIGPFRVLSSFNLHTKYKRQASFKKLSFVAISFQRNRAQVKRFRATRSELSKIAYRFLDKTEASTIVGEFAGMTASGDPIFRSVLKANTDPLSDEALTRWINQAARRLNIIAAKESAEMIDEMLEWIDFEWATASGETWTAARVGIEGVFRTPSAGMITAQRISTSEVLERVLRRTTGAAVKLPGVVGNIAAGFRLPNRQISNAMMQHHGFFVRDQYGRIAPGLAAQVQPIITRGIEQGLGRREIDRILRKEIKGGLQQRGYWETVSANAVTRSRSYSLASSFTAAGIERYRIEAIIDEATTETCMMLHGMILPVAPGLANLNRIISPQSTPEDTMRYQPFIRVEEDEFRAVYPDDTYAVIGTRQGEGQYTRGSAEQIVGADVGFPPYHHRCRTTVIPEV